ncbi:ComF family protein [Marinobacter caseinilyticus]|uniref:ComF family protein n=1 Tax=Marinobacter caseinilyticus TaxID=2692195 RepID=UPI001F2499A9|nr:ComF family protein [Marinobacter caseinilyticus]
MALCGECIKQPPPFDHVIAPLRYEFPVDRLTSRFKYRQQRSMGYPLVNLLGQQVLQHLGEHPDWRPELLVPSPMHAQKQRARGFNQAEDIAEQLSRVIDVPWSVTLMQRWKPGVAQSGLNRRQRLANLRGAFTIAQPAPARVAIVDDVMTTGATARALAVALRKAGAQRIELWVLARTPG